MESPEPTPGPSRRVGVVVLDTFPPGGRTALARVLVRLGEAGQVDPPILRVIAGRSPREVAAVGGPDELELGAGSSPGADLTAAAALLAGRCGCDLMLVLAGAPASDEEELLDRYALDAARRLDAIVGSLEPAGGGARARLAGGCFLLPVGLAERLAEGSPGGLAGVRAGLAAQLRRRGRWDVETPFGSLARELGVAVVDFRTVRALGAARVGLGSITPEERTSLVGLPGLAAGAPVRPPREHWIDEARLPERIDHGATAEVRLRGWIAGEPRPEAVAIRAGERTVASGAVRVPRPDVLAHRPELGREECGFDLVARVGPFAPGRATLSWSADGGPPSELGQIVVTPVHRVGLARVLVPPRPVAERPQPVRVEGSVTSTGGGVGLEVEIDGRPLRVEVAAPRPGADSALPTVTTFVATGSLAAPVPATCRLTVRSRDAAGATDAVERELVPVVDAALGLPVIFDRRETGDHDPATGRTPLRVEGVVFGVAASDRLVLRGTEDAPLELARSPLEASEAGAVAFALGGEPARLPPGERRLELVRLAADGSATVVAAWSVAIEALGARALGVVARGVAADPDGAAGQLVVEGGLEGAERVESLALAVDGRVELWLGAEWLACDETGAVATAGLRRFRFDGRLPLEPGVRALEIRARRGRAEVPVWSGSVEVARPGGSPDGAAIACAELDRLLREDPAPVWSRLVLDGRVVGAAPGAEVRLRLEGEEVAVSPVAADGGFRLVARPAPDRVVEGSLEVVRGGARLVAVPSFRIATRALEPPPEAIDRAAELLELSRIVGEGGRAPDARDALTRLVELEPGRSAELFAALAAAGQRAEAASARPARIVEQPEAPAPERPLSVLFAAWEVPAPDHGGGVLMANLLRSLGGRHPITLVHAQAPGEEGRIEALRPFLREIVAARREWAPSAWDRELGVPEELARSRSPGLRRLVAAEAATGRFDLIDYEYTEMALHAAAWGPPAVGALYESRFFAEVADGVPAGGDADAAARWLGRVIEALHLETAIVAERFGHLLLLTREEAERLAPWLPGRTVFVQPIPVDLERFARVERAAAGGPPTFAFLGNYVHPPNREAAEWLATRVAPVLAERLPAARWVIGGASPPAAVLERAQDPGLTVPGFVEDLDGFLGAATAFVAPLFSGGGMRVKLLEAMAAGCPVITTRRGLNGIRAEPGREVLLAETVEEFVAAAERLAADPAAARALGEAGRAAVAREHSLERQAVIRERIWSAVAGAGRTGG